MGTKYRCRCVLFAFPNFFSQLDKNLYRGCTALCTSLVRYLLLIFALQIHTGYKHEQGWEGCWANVLMIKKAGNKRQEMALREAFKVSLIWFGQFCMEINHLLV